MLAFKERLEIAGNICKYLVIVKSTQIGLLFRFASK